jgi:hypothetical protein
LRTYVITALTLLVACLPTASGDIIAPSYTVTDLGTEAGFVNPPGANGAVSALNGPAYAFPQTFTGSVFSWPTNFPLLDPVPKGSSGIAGTGYSFVSRATLYPDGIVIATDRFGFSAYGGGSASWHSGSVYYVQRNSDGSWGQPVGLMSATTDYGSGVGYAPNVDGTLSKSGSIVENKQWAGFPGVLNDVAVYNMNTHVRTDLSTLPVLVSGGYSNLRAPQIDDAGRILLRANHESPSGQMTDDLVLLTPSGVSSTPLPSAAPEPGGWVVMALAMASLAALRLRGRRRQS